MEKIKSVKSANIEKGTRVLVRIDANTPISDGEVSESFRLEKVLPTLDFLRERGARVVLLAHHSDKKQSLKPVLKWFKGRLPIDMREGTNFSYEEKFVPKEGEFLLLENLRFDEREEKNDDVFSKELSKWGDIYVNEAFSASHRAHSSIVGIPKYLPSFVGFDFENEYKNLSNAFNPKRPSMVVLGGIKSDTKIPIMKNLSSKTDTFFIGGATANDFLKALGLNIGKSIFSESGVVEAMEALSHMTEKIRLPVDCETLSAGGRAKKRVEDVLAEDLIFDIGEMTTKMIIENAEKAEFILWNGPLGNIEKGFSSGTESVALALSKMNKQIIIGGGDSVGIIRKLDLENKFSFISGAGGAMLDFLANGTLVGIEAVSRN